MTNDTKLYYVYKHTSPSGKVYIGITSKHPPERRWANGNGYKKNQPHYDINHVFIATYTSANQAEFYTGIKANNIRACCNGDQKTSGGFIWRYDNGSN